MKFPQTLGEMEPAGYKYDNDSECRSCKAGIQWWITPKGKSIPMNSMIREGDPAVAHWTTCPAAKEFRKGG